MIIEEGGKMVKEVCKDEVLEEIVGNKYEYFILQV